MTISIWQEEEEVDDHTARGLILHLSGPAHSRRTRVAQWTVRAVKQKVETAVQSWQKAKVVKAGATAEPHAGSAVASRSGWLRSRPSVQIEAKEGPRAGPEAVPAIRRCILEISNDMRRTHASAESS
jgi:hypothetical protein